jgi:hypothetical protein
VIDHDLTDAQKKTAIALIDDAGADAWDEGDFDWTFKSVRCDLKTGRCVFTIEVQDQDGESAPKRTFVREGHIDGIHKFADLVETFANSNQAISSATFDKVVAMIDVLTKTIPPR